MGILMSHSALRCVRWAHQCPIQIIPRNNSYKAVVLQMAVVPTAIFFRYIWGDVIVNR